MAFWRSYGHLVWGTKNRQPWIDDSYEQRLYGYMVKRASDMGCYVYAINGLSEHVHMALTTPPKHSISHIVQDIKGASARFVNDVICPERFHFGWQRGYGYLTFGQAHLDWVIAYVENQKRHHDEFSTNAWLERFSDVNEGPDVGKTGAEASDSKRTVLTEERVGYDVFGEYPF